MKVVAVIPARGGSKKVPNKNLKSFCGQPLITWTILTALQSKKLDRVIVSTDSKAIAKVAKNCGAEVPFSRPAELATDVIGIEPVMKHVYQWLLEKEGYKADGLLLLFVTNPLRQVFHINQALDIFEKTNCDSVISVNETPPNHTPYWTFVKSDSGEVCLFGGTSLKNIIDRRQDFPQKCYARNELIYLLKPQNLYQTPSRLYGQRVELYETSPVYEVDINSTEDWELAELRFRQLRQLSAKSL